MARGFNSLRIGGGIEKLWAPWVKTWFLKPGILQKGWVIGEGFNQIVFTSKGTSLRREFIGFNWVGKTRQPGPPNVKGIGDGLTRRELFHLGLEGVPF